MVYSNALVNVSEGPLASAQIVAPDIMLFELDPSAQETVEIICRAARGTVYIDDSWNTTTVIGYKRLPVPENSSAARHRFFMESVGNVSSEDTLIAAHNHIVRRNNEILLALRDVK